jgi:hypothetical protein
VRRACTRLRACGFRFGGFADLAVPA